MSTNSIVILMLLCMVAAGEEASKVSTIGVNKSQQYLKYPQVSTTIGASRFISALDGVQITL